MKFRFFDNRLRATEADQPPMATNPAMNQVTVRGLLDNIQASGEQTPEVVLDLSDVQRINSEELRDILRLHLSFRERDGKLVLANARGMVADMIALTRLERTVEVRGFATDV